MQQQIEAMEGQMKELQGENETLERQVVQAGIKDKIIEGAMTVEREVDKTQSEQKLLRQTMSNHADLLKKELTLEEKNNNVDK